jgi:hypothetical protein
MPILPERRKLYPPRAEWQEIRRRILARAGNCCEGSPRFPDCRARNHEPHPVTGSKVVLTMAHLGQDPRDNREEGLRAWCQRCHLTYDAAQHAETRRLRRAGLARDISLSLPLEEP